MKYKDEIIPDKKKAIIICSEEEYPILYKYFDQVIDTSIYIPIVPGDSLEYETIQLKRLKKVISIVKKEEITFHRYSFIKRLLLEEELNNKYNLFLNQLDDVDEVFILESCNIPLSFENHREKIKEINTAIKIYKKRPTFVNMKSIVNNEESYTR